MDKKRRKWNARELFILIDGGLRELRRQASGKGGNTFWKNCDMIYTKVKARLFCHITEKGEKWARI